MANKSDKEYLVDKLVETGLVLVKLEDLIEAYQEARSQSNNPHYITEIIPPDQFTSTAISIWHEHHR